MNSQLASVSKLFTEQLFRIPDFQRGYAWGERQLKDFWNDIEQLEPNKNHYVGVLTVERVPESVYLRWDDDLWIIKDKGYEPYYIVDGQQRMTTIIILVQSILDRIDAKTKLNHFDRNDIKRKYLHDSPGTGISRSYIFGYEKDNPSYEFLKTKIFREPSSSDFGIEETIYTQNLKFAKDFLVIKLNRYHYLTLN